MNGTLNDVVFKHLKLFCPEHSTGTNNI